MIDDSMIKRLAVQCNVESDSVVDIFTHEELSAFAKACYAAGQDEQKEKVAEYIMNKGDEEMTDWQWGFTWCIIIEVIAWNVFQYFGF